MMEVLSAWRCGEDSLDADVGGVLVGRFVRAVVLTLTKKG